MSEEWIPEVHKSKYSVEDLSSGESNYQVEKRLRETAEQEVARLKEENERLRENWNELGKEWANVSGRLQRWIAVSGHLGTPEVDRFPTPEAREEVDR